MKKACIILSIITIACFIISGIIFATKVFSADNLIVKNIDEKQEIEFAGKHIYVSGIYANTNIQGYDGDVIKIELVGTYRSFVDDSLSLHTSEGLNSLNISIKSKKIFNIISFGVFTSNIELNILIPNSMLYDLTIDGVDKGIKVSNLNLYNLKLSGVSGKIDVLNVTTQSIDVNGISGNINLDNITGNLDISSVSGDIQIKYLEFDNNIDINGVSSSVMLYLPKGSDFKLDTDGIHTSVSYYIDNVKQNLIKTNSKNLITIDGVSSSIAIYEY